MGKLTKVRQKQGHKSQMLLLFKQFNMKHQKFAVLNKFATEKFWLTYFQLLQELNNSLHPKK